MNQYEAMFIIDPTFGATFETCEQEVKRLMDRAEAEVLFCKKWDDRRLAYKIKGRKRGVYVLTFFRCDPEKVAGIERDVHISENVLRVLVLRADHMTPDMMEQAATPVAAAQDDGYDSRRPSWSRDGGRRPRDGGGRPPTRSDGPSAPKPVAVGAPAADAGKPAGEATEAGDAGKASDTANAGDAAKAGDTANAGAPSKDAASE